VKVEKDIENLCLRVLRQAYDSIHKFGTRDVIPGQRINMPIMWFHHQLCHNNGIFVHPFVEPLKSWFSPSGEIDDHKKSPFVLTHVRGGVPSLKCIAPYSLFLPFWFML